MTDQEKDPMTGVASEIEKLLNQQTFTPEVVAKVNGYMEQIKQLESTNQYLRKMRDSEEKKALDVQSELTQAKAEHTLILERHTKEMQMEAKVDVAEAKTVAYKDMFDRMFANRQFREDVTSSIPVFEPQVGGGGYHSSQYGSENKVITEE